MKFEDHTNKQLADICKYAIQRHGFLLRADLEANFEKMVLKKHPDSEIRRSTHTMLQDTNILGNGHLATELALKAIYNKYQDLSTYVDQQKIDTYIDLEHFSGMLWHHSLLFTSR